MLVVVGKDAFGLPGILGIDVLRRELARHCAVSFQTLAEQQYLTYQIEPLNMVVERISVGAACGMMVS